MTIIWNPLRFDVMQYLNPNIERLVKSKKKSLLRKQISCGIFQEIMPTNDYSDESNANREA